LIRRRIVTETLGLWIKRNRAARALGDVGWMAERGGTVPVFWM
jgi:hypothetical protein